MSTVRCPMPECRRRIELGDLEVIPRPPAQPEQQPCLHFIAAYGGDRGPLAEAVLFALTGNREFLHRSLRPVQVSQTRIDEVRADLDRIARSAAHEVRAADGPASDRAETGDAVLFGDRHEAAQVAREFAHYILGPDPILGGGFR